MTRKTRIETDGDTPARTRLPGDPEINLIGRTLRGLAELDPRARRRVVDYLTSWLESQERAEEPTL